MIAVGITGQSGSGKTTLAKRLLGAFGADAVVISHDDYYKNLPNMTEQEAAEYDFDCPEALDTYLLVDQVRSLKRGKPTDVPSYDFVTRERIDGACHVEPVPVVLVEGLFIMCDPELLDLLDLTIFIDADDDTSFSRRINRDTQERGIDRERALHMYYDVAKPAYEKFVEPLKGKADIVINDAADERAFEMVVRRIEGLLG